MTRWQLVKDDGHLTVTFPMVDRLLAMGCPLFVTALVCVSILGILALVNDTQSSLGRGGGFFDPHANHLGFFWLLALGVTAILVPCTVARCYRTGLVYSFSRTTGQFRRNNEVITPLRRIEKLRVRARSDPDEVSVYHLIVSYGDGHEIELHDTYNEIEIWHLAEEIGNFIRVPIIYG